MGTFPHLDRQSLQEHVVTVRVLLSIGISFVDNQARKAGTVSRKWSACRDVFHGLRSSNVERGVIRIFKRLAGADWDAYRTGCAATLSRTFVVWWLSSWRMEPALHLRMLEYLKPGLLGREVAATGSSGTIALS